MHRTNHDRINGAVSNQLPAESLIDMIVNTQTYRLGNECCAVLYICTGLQKYKKNWESTLACWAPSNTFPYLAHCL